VYAVRAFVSIDTNVLWFRAVGHESVYTRIFWTEALLFFVFGLLMAAALAQSLVWFHRNRPPRRIDPVTQRWRHLFFRIEPRIRKWLLLVIVVYFGVSMGARATGGWQTWLAWRHAVSTGTRDPQFHRDISYFLFVYPLHRFVLTLLFRIVATCLIAVLVVGYWYGAIVLRGPNRGISKALQTQLSALLGLYLVLKVFGYWLDRYALATSNRGVVTGPSYTDVHAVLPGKFVLFVIATVCAAAMLANVYVRRPRLMVGSIGLLAASAFVFGVAWPKLEQQFREKPSAQQLEQPYIKRNIEGTLAAYGLDKNVATSTYTPAAGAGGAASRASQAKALLAQTTGNVQIRLLDPNQLSPTFTVLQQVRSYYTFKSTLDVDRYPINGKLQDVAIAVRELNTSGLPGSKQSWTNAHLVYTHGYGLVAAPTDQSTGGAPTFVEGGIPPAGALALKVPQVYYGQVSNSYSVVGAPKGTRPKEFDHPATSGTGQANTTHVGGGGVPIGSWFQRLVYALKLKSTSLLFSSEINKDSQLIYNTNPRNRVAAVAPWLTLDGDVYPVVVNGGIDWVVDGYTTSNNYPYSQQVNLRSATTTTLTKYGSSVTQPSTSVNYMRNSVKAVVNAYTGKVTLYAWNPTNTPDPVLATWEKAFPHLVQPQSAIPAALLPHLRYPTDLFNVQRYLLARYHVTNAADFYSGSDFWQIPNDPTVSGGTTTNALGKKVALSAPTLPSTYMTLSPTGSGAGTFALSSPLVTLNSRNLAAYLSVNSQPGPDYGRFTLLELPSDEIIEAPAQIQNDIESTPQISSALSVERLGASRVVVGNLLAIPLDGQMLYVEPIYTKTTGSNGFPTLRHIVAIYGNGPIGFSSTLTGALEQTFGVTPGGAVTPTTTTSGRRAGAAHASPTP
jgi:uncharacterized membrane protein (UPF0182 family)